MSRTKRLDSAVLEAALAGLEAQRQRIDQQIAEVGARIGGSTANERTVRPRRPISAAGRKRIAAAQKKRWAKLKQVRAEEAKPKRRLSAVGRKHIADAARKRWAEIRAAKAGRAPKPASASKPAGRAAAHRGVPKKPARKKESAAVPVETAQQ